MTNRCFDVGPISPANVTINWGGPSLYKKGTNTTRMKKEIKIDRSLNLLVGNSAERW